MRNNTLISIIIPIYNSENYIYICVESILNQTYKNIEIILVNDGSTDKSAIICDSLSNEDKRIIVKHKKNEGPGAARRDGLKLAKGQYIGFVDSDDYVQNEMFERLLAKSKEGFDIVQCGYKKVDTMGNVLLDIIPKKSSVIGDYNCSHHYAVQNSTNFLWDKLYSAFLFKGIIFPELSYGEDSCVLCQLFANSKSFSTLEDSLYYHVNRDDSLVNSPFTKKRLDNIESGKFMYDFYKVKYPSLSAFAALHICSYSAILYREVYNLNTNNRESILNQLRTEFSQHYNYINTNIIMTNSSWKKIMKLRIFKICPYLYVKIMNVKNSIYDLELFC